MIPAVLIVITLHELSHGFAAYLLGDNTAKDRGRLTFNPIAHIDIFGFLCMLVAGIGWAKPVPVSPYNFKMKNKKIGMAITALAGPLANLVLAFVFLFILSHTRPPYNRILNETPPRNKIFTPNHTFSRTKPSFFRP